MYIPPENPRSKFVTALSIVMIIFAAKFMLISVIMNVMMNVMYVFDMDTSGMSDQDVQAFQYFRIGMAIFLLFSAFFLTTALSLYKRKNWARIATISLLVFYAIMVLVGAGFQKYVMDQAFAGPDLYQTRPIFLYYITIGGTWIMTIGMLILFGWLIKKLRSEKIVKEFTTPLSKNAFYNDTF